MLLALLAQTAIPFTPPKPKSAAELRTEAASQIWGECIGAASNRLARADSRPADAVIAESFAACEGEEGAAREAYAAYLREIGAALSAGELADLFMQARAQASPRLAGCIAESRARAAGDPPKPC